MIKPPGKPGPSIFLPKQPKRTPMDTTPTLLKTTRTPKRRDHFGHQKAPAYQSRQLQTASINLCSLELLARVVGPPKCGPPPWLASPCKWLGLPSNESPKGKNVSTLKPQNYSFAKGSVPTSFVCAQVSTLCCKGSLLSYTPPSRANHQIPTIPSPDAASR